MYDYFDSFMCDSQVDDFYWASDTMEAFGLGQQNYRVTPNFYDEVPECNYER